MRIFSGMRPTGQLHIGNYFGALKNWLELQKKASCIFGVVDYHGITTPFNPKTIHKETMNLVLNYLAVGINPKKSTIIIQSQIPEHTELAWILGTLTPLGELERMTQFKEKGKLTKLFNEMSNDLEKLSQNLIEYIELIKKENLNIGKKIERKKETLTILEDLKKFIKELKKSNLGKKIEESDINLWLEKKLKNIEKKATNIKPLEKIDERLKKEIEEKKEILQKNLFDYIINIKEFEKKRNIISSGIYHYPVLMAADILLYKADLVPVGEDQRQHVELARTIARKFNNKFSNVFPLPKTQLVKTGARIMSLTDPTKKMSKTGDESIDLNDSPALIRQKIKKAVTDSGKEIKYSKSKPAISNLLTIYHLFSSKSISDLEKKYKGKGYGEFKKDLAEIIIEGLKPFQAKRKKYEKNPKLVKKILAKGQKEAQKIAQATMKEVKKKMGLI